MCHLWKLKMFGPVYTVLKNIASTHVREERVRNNQKTEIIIRRK